MRLHAEIHTTLLQLARLSVRMGWADSLARLPMNGRGVVAAEERRSQALASAQCSSLTCGHGVCLGSLVGWVEDAPYSEAYELDQDLDCRSLHGAQLGHQYL